MNLSLGVIETYGLTAAIHAADAACKSAAVTVLGYKKIGSGLVSVFFAGEISAVKTAIDSGVAVIKQPAFIKGQLVIARPEKQVVALLTGLKGKELTPPAAKVPQEPPAPVAEVAAAPVVEAPVADNKPARTGGKKESK
ncbi:BMC domain-containing protein [Serratia fonticola]|uniref:BMC domain-containing protein n=1 Tax=Serratia fonticola TaxID=47917 RepID=UPI00217A3351|nr:BMC domain-containing protein [Serratia fonticola]CAI1624176.1 Propanediol utilization protein PduA [Serratia fonticola]